MKWIYQKVANSYHFAAGKFASSYVHLSQKTGAHSNVKKLKLKEQNIDKRKEKIEWNHVKNEKGKYI